MAAKDKKTPSPAVCKVRTHARCMRPKISVVVSTKDAQAGLVPCLKSLTDQSLETFEVVVVDCGSHDESAAITACFSGKDGRFTALQAGDQAVPEGFAIGASAACGDILLFADPQVALKRKLLAHLVRAFEECPHAELLVFEREFSHLPKKLAGAKKIPENHAIEVKADDLRDRLTMAAPNVITNKAFRASFYRTLEDPFGPNEDGKGALTSTKALSRATCVALMRETAAADGAPEAYSYDLAELLGDIRPKLFPGPLLNQRS